jgi:transcriptional regulator with XRE-family HTH domain
MEIDAAAGARVRALRTERGLSQGALCGPGISRSYLSLIESGRRRPTPPVLRTLADALGTTAEYLATGRTPPPMPTEHLLIFAELALHNGSPDTALEGFTAALAALTAGDRPAARDAELRRRAELGHARALELLGRLGDAAYAYDVLWRATEPGTMTWAQLGIDVCRCHRDAGDLDYAAEIGERALALFESLDLAWSDEAIRLGVTLAGVYRLRGDLLRAQTLLRRLTALADELGSPLARGSAYWNAAIVAERLGRSGDAVLLAEKAVALFGETDRARNLAMVRDAYGHLLVNQGSVAQGRRELRAAYAAAVEVASASDLAHCLDGLVVAALADDDLPEARARVDEAMRLNVAELDPALRSTLHVRLAQVQLGEGDPAAARDSLATAHSLLEGSSRRDVEAWQEIAELWEQQGEPALANDAYRRCLEATGMVARRAAVRRRG